MIIPAPVVCRSRCAGCSIRIAALAAQRGLVSNITSSNFKLVGVRENAVDIDAYGQGHSSDSNSGSRSVDDVQSLLSLPRWHAGMMMSAGTSSPLSPSQKVPCGKGTPPSPLPGTSITLLYYSNITLLYVLASSCYWSTAVFEHSVRVLLLHFQAHAWS